MHWVAALMHPTIWHKSRMSCINTRLAAVVSFKQFGHTPITLLAHCGTTPLSLAGKRMLQFLTERVCSASYRQGCQGCMTKLAHVSQKQPKVAQLPYLKYQYSKYIISIPIIQIYIHCSALWSVNTAQRFSTSSCGSQISLIIGRVGDWQNHGVGFAAHQILSSLTNTM